MKRLLSFLLLFVLLASSCAVSKNFNPAHKYAPEQLQQDFAVFQTTLEAEHPGLYWYTPKDSMDYYFNWGKGFLKDSMTEARFRTILSYITAKIHCGHTTVRPSKAFMRLPDSLRQRPFPLSLKIWPDTAVVTLNTSRRDSIITRGALVTAIDGKPMQAIVDTLFGYLSADGYNLTHKYQTLSNRGAFSSLYTAVFGYKKEYQVAFIDTLGVAKNTTLHLFAVKDTSARARQAPLPRPKPRTRRERKRQELVADRALRYDSAARMAFMDLNTFTKDARLYGFFRKAFKKLAKDTVQHLVIDLRGNGGGSVTNSNLLTKYIAQKPFKIADTLFATTRNSPYGRYQQQRLWNWIFLTLMTHKKSDGHYHFRYFEKKHFKPKERHHYNGQVYVLTGGNTFSASTLFIQCIKNQDNVHIVGEETGGGAYGNNAWLIPDVTLPNTKVAFRLPLFRLVMDKTAPKGWGIPPTLPALPTVNAIRQNRDFKTEKVYQAVNAQKEY